MRRGQGSSTETLKRLIATEAGHGADLYNCCLPYTRDKDTQSKRERREKLVLILPPEWNLSEEVRKKERTAGWQRPRFKERRGGAIEAECEFAVEEVLKSR